MRVGRIGGSLIVGGSVPFLFAVAIVAAGGGTCIGCIEMNGHRTTDLGGVVLAAGLALVGTGCAVLSIAGPSPYHRARLRLSLGTLAVGLLTYLTVSVASTAFALEPSATPPLLAFVVGLSAMVIGALGTGLFLVMTRGPCRVVGVLFLAGLLFLVLREALRPYVGDENLLGALAVLGWTGVFLSGVGVGLLGIDGARSASLATV